MNNHQTKQPILIINFQCSCPLSGAKIIFLLQLYLGYLFSADVLNMINTFFCNNLLMENNAHLINFKIILKFKKEFLSLATKKKNQLVRLKCLAFLSSGIVLLVKLHGGNQQTIFYFTFTQLT
jgi:hypothetical protein